jgi:GNAT superfamily N-acetyltransferase
MRDDAGFATQWAGMVALLRLQGANAPGATLIERDGMVACVMPVAPDSSIKNCALAADPTATPTHLDALAEAFEHGGANKWGLWVDGEDERAARAALAQGMFLDSRPVPMIARLDDLPFDDAPPRTVVDLPTAGRLNDLAYGYAQPKLAPAIEALPPSVLTYGDENAVAMAFDVGTDTAVWFVATHPNAQRQGRASNLIRRLLLDARDRGQRTSSLQGSTQGAPLYERLGYEPVGSLHLYEQLL